MMVVTNLLTSRPSKLLPTIGACGGSAVATLFTCVRVIRSPLSSRPRPPIGPKPTQMPDVHEIASGHCSRERYLQRGNKGKARTISSSVDSLTIQSPVVEKITSSFM